MKSGYFPIKVLCRLIPWLVALPATAQSIVPAADGTATLVTIDGQRYDINGGTLSNDGKNLFHSFEQLNLNAGEIANFFSQPAILNILGRVVGGDASTIDGLIQVTGGNANLLLLNPSGIVFGANASLNVPGAFTATTANRIGFDAGWFNASGSNNYGAIQGSPNQFAFTTAHPGSIINAGNLAVSPGNDLVLLGGTILSTGTLMAPAGNLLVSTVPGESLVRIGQQNMALSLEVEPLGNSGTAGVNDPSVQPLDLPRLLTLANAHHATGAVVAADGTVQLTGSDLEVAAGDVVVRDATAQMATVSAERNLTLVESVLQTSGDLNLLAEETVTVRDSVAEAFLAQAGGDLLIQGKSSIDILALNHLTTPFQSGGDVTLVSNGFISGDAHFSSGGSFSLLNTAGEAGTFSSFFDPIFNVGGDLNIGTYTGVALKVVAGGNIMGNDITITGPDVPGAIPVGDPDFAILTSERALILEAGGNIAVGSLTTLETQMGAAALTSTGGTIRLNAGGSITTGNINSSASTLAAGGGGGITVTGGAVSLTAGTSISTGEINSSTLAIFSAGTGDSSATSGAISLTAGTRVSTGNINSSSDARNDSAGDRVTAIAGTVSVIAGSTLDAGLINAAAMATLNAGMGDAEATAGAVRLEAGSNNGSNIRFSTIDATANVVTLGVPFTGEIATSQNVDVLATGTVQGTGTLGNGTTIDNHASATAGAIAVTGGNVTIQHDGGVNNVDFILGDASQNGLAGSIRTTANNILASASFPVLPNGGSVMPTSEITITSINDAPTLSANTFLPGAPIDLPFQFNASQLAPSVLDINLDNTEIQVVEILTGSLFTINSPLTEVTPGTVLSVDDVLVYIPPLGRRGRIDAFRIQANDGVADSNIVTVSVEVSEPLTLLREKTIPPLAVSPLEASCDLSDSGVSALDEKKTREYESYLGISAAGSGKGLADACRLLAAAAGRTGVKPALIYTSFIPASIAALEPMPETEAEALDPHHTRRSSGPIDPHHSHASHRTLPASIPIDPRKSLDDSPVPSEIQWRFNSPQFRSQRSAINRLLERRAQQWDNLVEQDDDQLELVVVTQEQVLYKRIPGVTRKQVQSVAKQFIGRVTDRARRLEGRRLAPAQQLYQWLVAPVDAELQAEGIENLAFIMDAGLRSLPVAALHNGEEFLVERYSVGTMPSLSLTDTRYADIENFQLLAMGTAVFPNQNQPPLPAVPIELTILTERLWSGRAFLGSAFTVRNLQQARASRSPFGIVHLATHAEFRPGKPENSYIQFRKQKVSVDQLRELKLHDPAAELLVLSACKTAVGDREAELGFTGLAVQAGVKSALGSLWYVSDEGTMGLMTNFYEQLRQAPIRAEALRQAQLAMIRGEVRLSGGELVTPTGTFSLPPELSGLGDQVLSHPYYWSAFTLVGNPW